MLSTAPFFDKTLFKKGIKRTLPLTITHLVIWLFAMPVMVVNMAEYNNPILNLSEYIYMTAHIGGTLMAFFFCAAVLAVQNHYLYSARSVSFYHALPVHRQTIFTTNILVALAGLLVPMVFVGGMTWIVELANGLHGGGLYIVKWFLIYGAMCLFFTGFFTLCSHITGHVAAAPIIYVILNFTSIVVEAIVRYIPTMFLYGVQSSGTLSTGALSPIWYIYSDCFPRMLYDEIEHLPYKLIYNGAWYLAVIAFVGLLCMALAWLFYRKRQSESAGEFIAIRALRPVFKYCVTAGFALVLSILFYTFSHNMSGHYERESILWYTVCVLIAGAIGYFGSEMVLRKSLRVFKKSWKGFAAAVAAMLFFCAVLGLDLLGIESYVPEVDEVKTINIQAGRWDYTARIQAGDPFMEEALNLHKAVLNNKDALQNDWYRQQDVYNDLKVFSHISIDYELQSGKRVERWYRVPLLEYKNDERAEYTDLYGFTKALTDLHRQKEVVQRAYDGIFDAPKPFDVYHASAYLQGASIENAISHTAYVALEEALRKDLLNGTLAQPHLEGIYPYPTTEAWEVTDSGSAVQVRKDDTFTLRIELERDVGEGEYENRYYHIEVTALAENTWAVLTDPNTYQEIPKWYVDGGATPQMVGRIIFLSLTDGVKLYFV